MLSKMKKDITPDCDNEGEIDDKDSEIDDKKGRHDKKGKDYKEGDIDDKEGEIDDTCTLFSSSELAIAVLLSQYLKFVRNFLYYIDAGKGELKTDEIKNCARADSSNKTDDIAGSSKDTVDDKEDEIDDKKGRDYKKGEDDKEGEIDDKDGGCVTLGLAQCFMCKTCKGKGDAVTWSRRRKPRPLMCRRKIDEMLRQLRDALDMVSKGPRSVLIQHLEMSIEALTVVADQMRYQEEPEAD